MSWFNDGKKSGSRDAFSQDLNSSSPFSFHLKAGETKDLIFIDDAAFGINEATIKTGPKDFESYTIGCEDSVLMQNNKNVNKGYREYYTVMDLTTYKAKDGTMKQYSRKALKVPKSIGVILDTRRVTAGGNLIGCRFRVTRSGSKDAACGNDWQYIGRLEASKIPRDVTPYDWPTVLKPKSEKFLEGVLKRASGDFGDSSFTNDLFAPSGFTPSTPFPETPMDSFPITATPETFQAPNFTDASEIPF